MKKEFQTITGAELLSKPLQEIQFVVDSLIPKGLHILAGAPKVGKSWLALWLALAVSKGEEVWDNKTVQGTTLYLCFEDNEIRIQNRLFEITDDAPNSVYFCTEQARLDTDLEEKIRNFVKGHADTNLIIIDTLQTVRSIRAESTYGNDYAELLTIKNLAYEFNVAILLIHHLKKKSESDKFHEISGSTGLQGVADAMYVLAEERRGSGRATLYCIGRDIESREIVLERSEENVWIKVSDTLTDTAIQRSKFLGAISKCISEKKMFSGTPTELSALLGCYSDDKFSERTLSKNIRLHCKDLAKHGIIGEFRRSNGKRMIELTLSGVDSAVFLDTSPAASVADPVGTESEVA